MSKTARWTLYSIIIVAAMSFGYFVTFQQDPSTYTPADSWGTPLEETEKEDIWTATITGRVEAVRQRDSEVEEGEEPMAVDLHILSLESTGPVPVFSTTVEARTTGQALNTHLGRLPEAGDEVIVTTESSHRNPAYVEIGEVEFR